MNSLSLLLHNDKLPSKAINKFTQSEKLVPSSEMLAEESFDYDFFYHNQLTKLFEQMEFDVIYISLNLSDYDYLEMNGLRVAHHIRLTKEWKHIYTPIYFICQEEPMEIIRLNSLGRILLTKGIYIIKDLSIPDIKFRPLISENQYIKLIEKLEVNAPANYQSHHGIANEWALTRYSSMLEKSEEENYRKLIKKVSHLDYLKTLHFKYYESKFERQKVNPMKHSYTPIFKNITGITIGVIDDESIKGWGAFYDYLLSKSGAKIEVLEFCKGENKIDLVKRLRGWVDERISKDKVDLFIVDLRLHDDDFTDKYSDKLTGFQIIEYIKSKNKGIQIVVSSASNKVWNFQNSLKLGVDSFIIKESPETLNTRDETKKSLLFFKNEIEKATSKLFLADLDRRLKSMKNNNIFIVNKNEQNFVSRVFDRGGLLDQIFDLLVLDSLNESILNQCLLLSFQVLEKYCDLTIVGSFGYSKSNSPHSKLSSGFVWKKEDNTKFDIFISKSQNELSTMFELKFDVCDFMIDSAQKIPLGYSVFDKLRMNLSNKGGLDASFLVKMISVLHFREGIDQEYIERLMKLRYYRSNLAAHDTGKIKPSMLRISAKDDIMFIIQIFEKIFTPT